MGLRILTWVRPKNNPASSRASIAPILDLLEPFPKPHDRVVTGMFATPFLGLISLIVVTENQSFLIVPLGFLVITFLTIAVHEFGHLLAGWWVGFQFRGVEIGPVTARRTYPGRAGPQLCIRHSGICDWGSVSHFGYIWLDHIS